jgi:hypothetical protein
MRMSLATVYTNYTTHIIDETEYPGRNQPMSVGLTDKLVIRFKKQSPSEQPSIEGTCRWHEEKVVNGLST